MQYTFLEKKLVLFLCIILLHSVMLYSEDNFHGPSQPEYHTFMPVNTSDMVNLSTGDFSYVLPLLDIPTSGGGTYPLSLHYIAGIGTHQDASFVGLGWNLNVGSISRMTVGIPDDYKGQRSNKRTKTKKAVSSAITISVTGIGNATFSHTSLGEGEISYSGSNFDVPLIPPLLNFSTEKGFHNKYYDQFFNAPRGGPVIGGPNTTNIFDREHRTLPLLLSNKLQVTYSEYSYKYNQNYNMSEYGYLYLDEWNVKDLYMDKFDQEGESVVNVGIADALDVFPFTKNKVLDKEDKYSRYSWPLLLPNSDSYFCMAEGIYNNIAIRRNVTQVIPSNNMLTYEDHVGWTKSTGYVHDDGYYNTRVNNPSNDPYGDFMFQMDAAGRYDPTSAYYPNSPDSEKPYANKVIPSFDDNGLISGFKIVTPDGTTYIFGQPVYRYCQYNEATNYHYRTYETRALQNGDYVAEYSPPELWSDDQSKIMENMKNIKKPLYAYNWLLTEITGSDYIDKNANGKVDDGDYGYWVQFLYEKVDKDGYIYRIPFGDEKQSRTTPPEYRTQYKVGAQTGPTAHRFAQGFGKNDLIYLRNVITDKAVAVFNIIKTGYGYESGDVVKGNVKGDDSYYMLDYIHLYKKDRLKGVSKGDNGVWDISEVPGQPYKQVKFYYGKSLNSQLTLSSVELRGKDDVVLPQYKFSYTSNEPATRESFDRWGFYKANGKLDDEDRDATQDYTGTIAYDGAYTDHFTEPEKVDNWSLSKIQLPYGGEIKINYESDAYNYVQNLPISGAKEAISQRENVKNFTKAGMFYSEDHRNDLTIPNGPNAIEIRSFAPGPPILGWHDKEGTKDIMEMGKYDFTTFGNDHFGPGMKSVIWKHEIPKDFTTSKLIAQTYVSPFEASKILKHYPDVAIVIYGKKANGERVTLNTIKWKEIRSPQWLQTFTDNGLPGNYECYEVILIYKTVPGNSGEMVLQRDFRVFILDQSDKEWKTGEIMKYGGGLRVKELSFCGLAGTPDIKKTYFYDDKGDGSGINTGVASIEPPPYNNLTNDDRRILPQGYGGLIPNQKVYYEKVTVNNSGQGTMVYEFLTPKSHPIQLDWNGNGRTRCRFRHEDNVDVDVGEVYYTVRDKSLFWGVLASKCNFSATSDYLEGEEYIYTDEHGKAYFDVMSIHGEKNDYTMSWRERDYMTNTTRHFFDMPMVEKIVHYKDGVKYDEVFEYNGRNGIVKKKSIRKHNDQNALREEVIEYAIDHPEYAEMEEKNMLDRVCAISIINQNGQTVQKQIFPWYGYNAVESDKQWYEAGIFTWNGIIGENPPEFPYSGALDLTNKVWKNEIDDWKLGTQVTKYDYFGHKNEIRNGNGVFSTAIYGYGNYLQTAYISNARFQNAAVFTCDYDEGVPGYFDSYNKWEKNVVTHFLYVSEKNPHFGKKSLYVYNNYGPTRNVSIDRTKKYVFSAWVCPASEETKYIRFAVEVRDQNKNYIADKGYVETDLTKDVWKLVEFEVDISDISVNKIDGNGDYFRIWIGNAENEEEYDKKGYKRPEFYVDDIRFYPSDALVKTYYYDDELAKPVAIVDENSKAKKFEYDEFGRLIKTLNHEGKVVSEAEYKMGLTYVPEYSFELIAPNGGETFKVDDEMGIKWRVKNFDTDRYNVTLYFSATGSSGPWYYITGINKIPYKEFSLPWVIPVNVRDGIPTASSNCWIKIQDDKYPEIFDISDGPFTIKERPADIEITSPSTGDEYDSEDCIILPIKWSAPEEVTAVQIFISTDEGNNEWKKLTENEFVYRSANDWGNFQWYLPAKPAEGNVINTNWVKIRIVGNNNSIGETGNFTISYHDAIGECTCTFEPQRLIIHSNHGGKVYKIGDEVEIVWSKWDNTRPPFHSPQYVYIHAALFDEHIFKRISDKILVTDTDDHTFKWKVTKDYLNSFPSIDGRILISTEENISNDDKYYGVHYKKSGKFTITQ